MKYLFVAPALIALSASLGAQSTFSGTVSGYVFDGVSRSIRPVLGSLGAAQLGSAHRTPWVYASISPNGKMALGIGRNSVDLVADLATPDLFAALSQIIRMPEQIVWSADSSTAVLYSPEARQMQRITGLGSAPAVQSAIDLSMFGAGAVAGWSVSPDGTAIALTTSAAGTASVYLLTNDSVPSSPLARLGDPGASAFSADGASLFVLDRATKKISKLQLPGGGVQAVFDASSVQTVQDIRTSVDGTLLYIAGQRSLSTIDLTTSTISSQGLQVTPASMTTFSVSPPVLLLDYPRTDHSPVWLFDLRASQAYFVPAGNSIPAGNAGGNASR